MLLEKYQEDLFIKGQGLFLREIDLIRNAPPVEPVKPEINKIEVL